MVKHGRPRGSNSQGSSSRGLPSIPYRGVIVEGVPSYPSRDPPSRSYLPSVTPPRTGYTLLPLYGSPGWTQSRKGSRFSKSIKYLVAASIILVTIVLVVNHKRQNRVDVSDVSEEVVVDDPVLAPPVWKELESPKLWSIGLGEDKSEKVSFENKVDFQSLKYGGPSATLLEQEIQSVDHSGCDVKDHLVATGKIAVIEGDSKDCDLWTAASHAEEVGAQAVLFYNGLASNALLESSLLPQSWKEGDPLISIPVLSITRTLGLQFVKNQASVRLTLETKILTESVDELNGDSVDDSEGKGVLERIWDALTSPWTWIKEKWDGLRNEAPKEGEGDGSHGGGNNQDSHGSNGTNDEDSNGDQGDDNDPTNEGILDRIKAAFGRSWEWLETNKSCILQVSLYGLGGAVFGVVALPLTLSAIPFVLGFGVEGIYAASCAATCMACHGGYTPAGGFVATMQALGTLGIMAGFNPVTLVIGAIAGLIGGGYYSVVYVGVCPGLL